MAAFEYKVLDAKGKQKKGVMEGDTSRQVRQKLKEQGLMPIEVLETKAQTQKKAQSALAFRPTISTKDLSLLTRQLSTLVEAGVPLEECLRAVADQSEKAKVKNMVVSIRSHMVEGYTLSDSFAQYPHVFDNLFCSMVAAGEKSGHLDTVLDRLADYAENRQKMRSKMQQAMIYPVMLTLIAISVIAFLLAAVVPKIVDQFVQMGQTLPLSTSILLAASDFVKNWGLAILCALILLYMGFKFWLKKDKNKLAWHKAVLALPVLGRVIKGLNTSRFARTLAICSSSAIPLLDGMKVAAQVMDNTYFRSQVLEASDRVREGVSLRQALSQTKLFPPMMLHMIASGEQSGELEPMLTRAADNQDRDFEAGVNVAMGVFEPLLIVFMAGIVLFIVVATMMPILELNNLVTK